jgi:hypothetical protein
MEGCCAGRQINAQRTKELMRILTFSEWTGLEMDFIPYLSMGYSALPETGLPRNRACTLINCYVRHASRILHL